MASAPNQKEQAKRAALQRLAANLGISFSQARRMYGGMYDELHEHPNEALQRVAAGLLTR